MSAKQQPDVTVRPPRRTAGRGIAGAIARLLRRKKRRRIQVASAQEIAAWNRHRQQLDHDDPGGYGHLW